MSRDDIEVALHALSPLGLVLREGELNGNFVVSDGEGRSIDVHVVRLDEGVNGYYRMANGETWIYTAEGLAAREAIGGQAVRCLTPEFQVACHDAADYDLDDDDRRDLRALGDRCRVALPNDIQ
jgi:lincosamide nucleotidyltransferase A/C/D/E